MQGLLHLGIDVGGTNTDTVVMAGREVIASTKCATSDDVRSGIVASVKKVLGESRVSPSDLAAVMIGTTQFTNAFVERRKLQKVAIIRLAAPATLALPPCVGWPNDLRDSVRGGDYILAGGLQYDGRDIAPLDEAGLVAACGDIRQKGISSIALSSVFSPIDQRVERRAAEIIGNEIPSVYITCSSDLGRIGFLERENATIMNASLIDFADYVVTSFQGALTSLSIQAPFFVSQNDGSLMCTDALKQFPVLTFASGPTNSMRGAAFLSGRSEGIVVDIGGTTTDVGVIREGFPRESSMVPDIGGVRTNFRMPDLYSLGVGGGSVVRQINNGIALGPDSVGSALSRKALVFGGDTLTTTDIAVAAGYADVGDPALVRHLDTALVEQTVCEIHRSVAEAIDRMKTSGKAVPVILVGGGSILINRDLPGVSDIVIPEHFPVANAIGAAMSQVSGDVDQVFIYGNESRDSCLARAREQARQEALNRGAEQDSIRIIDLEEIPIAYVPNGATRVRVRAVGDLCFNMAGGRGEG